MLQVRSILDVADNTGAKRAAAIGVLGRNQRYAGIGDIIKAHIKEAAPDGTVKKGEVVDAVVVRTRKAIRRNDGSYLRFDSNAIVIIDKEFNPRGTRIKFFVDDDDGIAIKSEIGTIIPSDRFARTDDDCIYHFAFFDRSVWRRFFDVGFDNITDVGVALIAAQYTDRCRALGAGVIGDIQNRANL